jgi:RNA polymerase sigma-70 factor, ECF subfamily
MLNWHTPEIYNKIGAYPVQVSIRRMPLAATEIERLNTLDPREISALHDQYYPEVYRFARFRVSDETLAEDIASEVFMRLLEAVHKRQGPKSNLKMWLIRTASNIVNDHYRNMYHHPTEATAEVLENHKDLFLTHPDPALMNEQEETNESVRAAINQLTDMQKLVITLRFGNRYSLEDTARFMGKEINTIKALQFRALESLRRLLRGERP